MSRKLGKAPGFSEHPGHTIRIARSDARWQVRHAGDVLAESSEVLLLEESGYAPVAYFPRESIAADRLRAVDVKTACPFKGEADYFALAGDAASELVAWTYPATYDEVTAITGFVAFYADRVDVARAA